VPDCIRYKNCTQPTCQNATCVPISFQDSTGCLACPPTCVPL
jgi:hypothetical protein